MSAPTQNFKVLVFFSDFLQLAKLSRWFAETLHHITEEMLFLYHILYWTVTLALNLVYLHSPHPPPKKKVRTFNLTEDQTSSKFSQSLFFYRIETELQLTQKFCSLPWGHSSSSASVCHCLNRSTESLNVCLCTPSSHLFCLMEHRFLTRPLGLFQANSQSPKWADKWCS